MLLKQTKYLFLIQYLYIYFFFLEFFFNNYSFVKIELIFSAFPFLLFIWAHK